MSRSTRDKLKGWKEEVIKINTKLTKLRIEKKSVDEEVNQLSKRRKNLQNSIDNERIKSSTQEVTDHAIVRYLERVLEFDIESIKKEILTGNTHKCKWRESSVITVIVD